MEHNAGCRYCLSIPEKRANEKASAIIYTVRGTVNEKTPLKQAIRTSSAAYSLKCMDYEKMRTSAVL